MRGIILGAGRGSRMQGLTAEQPKCLTVLAGRTLLDWQIDALKRAGVSEIAVVRGYRAEMLSNPSFATFDNPRWSETNMVMSLLYASKWLQQDTCIVSYSDIVYKAEIVSALAASDASIAITYDRLWHQLWSDRFANPLEDAETFRTDGTGRLVEIGARAASLEEIQGQYMGLLKFTPDGWSQVETYVNSLPSADQDKLDMTSLLRRLLAMGAEIGTVPVQGGWCEVDSESDLRLYQSKISTEKSWAHAWAG
jgi:L-glutamine-phosphate cytidylyltransferase